LPNQEPSGPFNSAFADLAALREELGSPEPEPPSPDRRGVVPPAGQSDDPPTLARRVVVQRERKGHGGKTVTRIRGILATPERRAEFARELAKRLGSGAKVQDDEIWVQGDQTERLQDILTQMGAERVVVGS